MINETILEKCKIFLQVLNDTELLNLFHNYIKIAFINFMNLGQNVELKLNEESLEKLKNIYSNDYIQKYISFYKTKTMQFIDPILEEKSLDFLDMQVKIEKESNQSIDIGNKKRKDDFKEIINNFLKSNFYYISQKYLLFKLFSDLNESYYIELEKIMNEIIIKNLENNNSVNLFEKKYEFIFNQFKTSIYNCFKNENIYEEEINHIPLIDIEREGINNGWLNFFSFD